MPNDCMNLIIFFIQVDTPVQYDAFQQPCSKYRFVWTYYDIKSEERQNKQKISPVSDDLYR